jgi:hypothetical protein
MNFHILISESRKVGYFILFLMASLFSATAWAQNTAQPRGMTAEEYKIAREVTVEDLDHDTYIKLADGKYVLDRYEMKPPYFITGDSGVKKRIDLYKLVDRASMDELGLVAFFTNIDAGSTFNLVIPNMATAGEVWNLYFDDIHQHDREEKDVALKMSYILSKEVAYLMQKSSGIDMSAMDQAGSDYDFCFPAQAMVTMADGSKKKIAEVVADDVVVTYEANELTPTKVVSVSVHKKADIKLSKVILIPEVTLTATVNTDESYATSIVELVATGNHPVMTEAGRKTIETLKPGDVLYRHYPMTNALEKYKVGFTAHSFDTTSTVYNLTTEAGSYLVDDVMVLGK